MDTGIAPLLRAEEEHGEGRANLVRLLVAALLLLVSGWLFLRSEHQTTAGLVVLVDLAALLVYALGVRFCLEHGLYFPSIKYVSAAVDLTTITIMAAASSYLSNGLESQTWIAVFAVFILFVALSGLRFSPSLCLFTSIVAAVEFIFLNAFVGLAAGSPLPSPQQAITAVVLVTTGVVISFTTRTARHLVIRASLAERRRAELATEADHAMWLATTDDLTGLHNRRYFLSEVKRELVRSSRHNRQFAILIIDMDHFKQVNDTMGHLVGDLVVRVVASILRENSRTMDVVARYGGDEFCMLVCEADLVQAEIAAERLRHAVRDFRFKLENGITDFRATLSIGLACYPAHGTAVEELLKAADDAVYEAKALGRDRIALARVRPETELTAENTKA